MRNNLSVNDSGLDSGTSKVGEVAYKFHLPINRPGQGGIDNEEDYAANWAAELPNCRITGDSTPSPVIQLPDCRNTSKAPFQPIYLNRKGEETQEGTEPGNSVIRQFGKIEWTETPEVAVEERQDADELLYELLPSVLRSYARSHGRTHNMNPLSACASVIFATSAALTKGVYVETLNERVHANLYVLNIAPSGSGKKGFGKPHEPVLRELGSIEARSKQTCGSVTEMRRKAEKDLRVMAEQLGVEAFEADAKYQELASEVAELSKLAESRKLACSDDATPQFVARSIVKPGQGGACLISSGEGAMFFERMGGRMKGASGYGTLLTKGFNDPDYILSRVDEGQQTHESTTNPRLTIGISIQNAKMADAVKDIPVGLGVFQRFLYVVNESRRDLPETASLFTRSLTVDPSHIAFDAMLKALTQNCWEVAGKETELTFAPDAAKLLDEVFKVNDWDANEIETDEPEWAQFVRRWIEQIIKLVQCFHVASMANTRSGEVNWTRVQEPISRETLEKTIRFHERWREETRRFYDQWTRPVVCTPGVVAKNDVEALKTAMHKALANNPQFTEGANSSSILKSLPKGWSGEALKRIVAEHPDDFVVTQVGNRGKTLYLPIANPSDFGIASEEGASDEH